MSSGLLLGNKLYAETSKAPFVVPANFSLTLLATNWGFSGSWDAFCARAKETGYDGVEVWLPQEKDQQDQLFTALQKHKLKFGFLAGSGAANFNEHLAQFQKAVEGAVSFKPMFVNCHSGRDYYSFKQNKELIDFTTSLSKSSGVPIYHETHRSRILYAAHVTKEFLEQIPALRLTLDISHWCNVHESLLHDQPEAVALAMSRTDHVHARVGHAESPQITDPRAPEWVNEVEAHFKWWDQIVKQKIAAGQPLTMTAEFGPPNYMPALPYTRQPLADLWEVNAHMMQLWKTRYS